MIAEHFARKGIKSLIILLLADFGCILTLGAVFGLFVAGLQKVLCLEQPTVNSIMYAFAFLALTMCILLVIPSSSPLKVKWHKESIEITFRLLPLIGLLLVSLFSAFASKIIISMIGVIVFIGISSVMGFLFYKIDETIDDEDDFW